MDNAKFNEQKRIRYLNYDTPKSFDSFNSKQIKCQIVSHFNNKKLKFNSEMWFFKVNNRLYNFSYNTNKWPTTRICEVWNLQCCIVRKNRTVYPKKQKEID